jgi:hypothetical protein
MSIPKNHHYVSQCHQKEFFNYKSGLIYLYDKEKDNFYNKKSTKKLFSEDHLNTKEFKGKIDQTTLEKELRILFEDNFSKHVDKVKQFLDSQHKIQDTYESLCWLTIIGILGELRHPQYKKFLDDTMIEFESDILFSRIGLGKEKIKNYLRSIQKTQYSNLQSYVSVALRILEKMEPLDFVIYSIESNDNFILPDTSCFQIRGQLKNYPTSFIKEIIQVGIPLNDKLFILATPQGLKSELHGIQFINEDNSKMVFEINKDLFDFSRKAVACKDQDFLRKTIEKIKNGSI